MIEFSDFRFSFDKKVHTKLSKFREIYKILKNRFVVYLVEEKIKKPLDKIAYQNRWGMNHFINSFRRESHKILCFVCLFVFHEAKKMMMNSEIRL